jgi:predicted transcriptional regulator
MAKTLTIRIGSLDEGLKRFRAAYKAVEAGRPVVRREGVYFTSLEAARNLLTPSRLALLRAVRTQRPHSIYELAKIVGRDLKNVQGDLRTLERYGLVRVSRGHAIGKRRVKTPQAMFGEIALRIAI